MLTYNIFKTPYFHLSQEEGFYDRDVIKEHNERFIEHFKDIGYLYNDKFEALIAPNGMLYKSEPSHQEALILIATVNLGIIKEQLYEAVPRFYYADMLTYLSTLTNTLPVWNSFTIGPVNNEQKNTLSFLRDSGVYNDSYKL